MNTPQTPAAQDPEIQARRSIRTVLLLFVCAAMVYAWLMPPWEAPDEPAHYVLAANLARINKFSTVEVNYEAHQPQTYYRLASIPLKLLYLIDPDWIDAYRPESNFNNLRLEIPVFDWNAENYRFLPGLYLLRVLNIAVSAAAVLVMYAGLRMFFPESEKAALSATIFFAFIPQFLHTSSAVSNDPLGILAGAVLFWALSIVIRRDLRLLEIILIILAAITLPLVTKFSVIPMGVVVLLAVALRIRAQRGYRWGTLAVAGIVFFLLVVAAELLFPGAVGIILGVISGRSLLFFEGAFEWETMRMMFEQLAWTFWGKIGWIGAGLPGWIILVLTLAGVFGLGSSILQLLRKDKPRSTQLTWAVTAASIAWFVVLRNGFYTIANQGRLIYPALGAISYTMIAGWRLFLPEKIWLRLPWIIGGMWLLVNLWLIFYKVLPIYYQPFE